MVRFKHKSFHLTSPPYMHGRRVKPRLRVISYLSCICSLVLVLLSAVAVILFVAAPVGAPLRNSVWGSLLFFGVPFLIVNLVFLAIKVFCRRYGLMTQEEARDFPFRGHWPESWLEPIEGGEKNENE